MIETTAPLEPDAMSDQRVSWHPDRIHTITELTGEAPPEPEPCEIVKSWGEGHGWCQHDADVVDRCRSIADRLEALEAVAVAARRAVDAIDEKSWWEASPIVAELNAALTALGSPTEDQRP